MASLIRWTRSDYAKLSRAVSSFNKKVNELEKMVEDDSFLPDTRDYKELKNKIVSRRELNRVIKSLKQFNQESSIKVTTSGGQDITKWEYKELKKSRRRALNNLAKEEGQIVLGRQSIGMGDERLQEIEATRKSIGKLENVKGSEFERIASRIESVGITYYKLAIDKQFMYNFYKAVKELKNYDNYELWIKNFVEPTINNIYQSLKIGGYVMINIKNLTSKGKEPLFDDWFNIFSSNSGFELVEVFEMEHQSKKHYTDNCNYTKEQYKGFKEPVMCFKKIY